MKKITFFLILINYTLLQAQIDYKVNGIGLARGRLILSAEKELNKRSSIQATVGLGLLRPFKKDNIQTWYAPRVEIGFEKRRFLPEKKEDGTKLYWGILGRYNYQVFGAKNLKIRRTEILAGLNLGIKTIYHNKYVFEINSGVSIFHRKKFFDVNRGIEIYYYDSPSSSPLLSDFFSTIDKINYLNIKFIGNILIGYRF